MRYSSFIHELMEYYSREKRVQPQITDDDSTKKNEPSGGVPLLTVRLNSRERN